MEEEQNKELLRLDLLFDGRASSFGSYHRLTEQTEKVRHLIWWAWLGDEDPNFDQTRHVFL